VDPGARKNDDAESATEQEHRRLERQVRTLSLGASKIFSDARVSLKKAKSGSPVRAEMCSAKMTLSVNKTGSTIRQKKRAKIK